MQRILILGASLLALAACDPQTFDSEAGAQIDSGSFGNATMHNTMVQSGQMPYVLDLGKRFAEEVPSTVNFAFDRAQLDAEARRTLDRQAHWINQFPEVRFRVYGHTDLVGSPSYNYQLGLRRANAVVNYLVSRGVARSRLEALVSHGETQPLIVTQAPERRNRRTVTEVSGFVENHPTVLNGQYARVVFREYVASATRPHPPTSGGGASLGGGG
ncbi:OmpA family protein [Alkalilacustris brevis]|uniref:OmpA family protein n=1 Tax=Alkalilacustris brevis TaxID=2026338 RepID=UPI001EE4A048|nr:OmpA family protein [Alkalilacustris brevis]